MVSRCASPAASPRSASPVHHRHPVAEGEDFVEVLGYEQHRRPAVPHRQEGGADLPGRPDVETPRRVDREEARGPDASSRARTIF